MRCVWLVGTLKCSSGSLFLAVTRDMIVIAPLFVLLLAWCFYYCCQSLVPIYWHVVVSVQL